MQNIIVRRKVIVQQTTLMQCIIETYRRNRKTLCRALDRKDQKLQYLLINTPHVPTSQSSVPLLSRSTDPP